VPNPIIVSRITIGIGDSSSFFFLFSFLSSITFPPYRQILNQIKKPLPKLCLRITARLSNFPPEKYFFWTLYFNISHIFQMSRIPSRQGLIRKIQSFPVENTFFTLFIPITGFHYDRKREEEIKMILLRSFVDFLDSSSKDWFSQKENVSCEKQLSTS
jgi:hypothetical protein